MDPERWEQVERLYRAVLDREHSVRDAFLEQACAGNETLRRDVESLLAENLATRSQTATSDAASGCAKPERFYGTKRLKSAVSWVPVGSGWFSRRTTASTTPS